MQKAVRPPTANTRRRQRTVQFPLPMEGFAHLMRHFQTGEVDDLVWEDHSRLTPTRTTKGFREYLYYLRKPEQLNRLWEMETWDRPIPNSRWRRGSGAQTLHLSQAAGQRGRTTLLVSSVTGNVTVRLREPLEGALPMLRLVFTVMSLDRNHAQWNQDFAPRTRAALKNMVQAGRRTMLADPLYPTPDNAQAILSTSEHTETVWQPQLQPLLRNPLPAALVVTT